MQSKATDLKRNMVLALRGMENIQQKQGLGRVSLHRVWIDFAFFVQFHRTSDGFCMVSEYLFFTLHISHPFLEKLPGSHWYFRPAANPPHRRSTSMRRRAPRANHLMQRLGWSLNNAGPQIGWSPVNPIKCHHGIFYQLPAAWRNYILSAWRSQGWHLLRSLLCAVTTGGSPSLPGVTLRIRTAQI